MIYRQRAPRPPLDRFVESIWVCQGASRPQSLERILPSGHAQLIVNLKENETRLYDPERPDRCLTNAGTVLSGVWSRYQVIDTSEQEYVAGVAFKAGGTVPFMRVPAHETRDADIPLEALWGSRCADRLRARLLEAGNFGAQLDVLEDTLSEQWLLRDMHPAVVYALTAFERVPRIQNVAEVTDAIGMSAKRFIERFKVDVGMTPKLYCRVRRFQRAVARAHRRQHVDWALVALDCGYFDQAHFVHDFRAFAGVTPTGYQAARTPFQNHVKFLQADDHRI